MQSTEQNMKLFPSRLPRKEIGSRRRRLLRCYLQKLHVRSHLQKGAKTEMMWRSSAILPAKGCTDSIRTTKWQKDWMSYFQFFTEHMERTARFRACSRWPRFPLLAA